MIGIYKITEKETGKCYVGQSKNIQQRWKQHQRNFPDSHFSYEVIREVSQVSFLNAFEKYYIKFYDSHRNGFNKTIGGTNIKTTHPSKETKCKISKSSKGKIISQNARGLISDKLKGIKRGPMSEQHKQKLSEAHKGMPSPNKGKKASNETRRKMSESAKRRRLNGD